MASSLWAAFSPQKQRVKKFLTDKTIHFRSVGDLAKCITANLSRIPREVEVVAGVPRSGMLPATLIALHLNLPLTDVDGLLRGKLLSCGLTKDLRVTERDLSNIRRILVVDDSIASGNQMCAVREALVERGIAGRCIFLAVYATPTSSQLVDLHFETLPQPRLFEWNLMHHGFLRKAAVDFDGVLCKDPAPDENDDGPRYERFLRDAQPLFLPSKPVGMIVTCRLEKWRPQTEEWLAKHGVKYGKLIMLDLPSKAERQKRRVHARFKSEVYLRSEAQLFIESCPVQAVEIAKRTGKPVLCVDNMRMFTPPLIRRIRRIIPRVMEAARRRAVAWWGDG